MNKSSCLRPAKAKIGIKPMALNFTTVLIESATEEFQT